MKVSLSNCGLRVNLSLSVASLITRSLSVASVDNCAMVKTAESPYMGRVLVEVIWKPLLRGPWPVSVELGRATVTPELPRAEFSFSVPLWLQPVRG